jgi:hypothetical protein
MTFTSPLAARPVSTVAFASKTPVEQGSQNGRRALTGTTSAESDRRTSTDINPIPRAQARLVSAAASPPGQTTASSAPAAAPKPTASQPSLGLALATSSLAQGAAKTLATLTAAGQLTGGQAAAVVARQVDNAASPGDSQGIFIAFGAVMAVLGLGVVAAIASFCPCWGAWCRSERDLNDAVGARPSP